MAPEPPLTNLEREYRRGVYRVVLFRGATWFASSLLAFLVLVCSNLVLYPIWDIYIHWSKNLPLWIAITAAALLLLGLGLRARGGLLRDAEGTGCRNCPRCGRALQGTGVMLECRACRASFQADDLERAWRAILQRFRKGRHYL